MTGTTFIQLDNGSPQDCAGLEPPVPFGLLLQAGPDELRLAG
jgi:hypothetical protein